MPAFWERYTKEEIQNFINQSNNLVDLCHLLGYAHKSYSAIQGIKKKYPDLKLPDASKPKWERYSEEELEEKLNNSKSLEDFFKKIGYNSRSSEVWKQIKEKYPKLSAPKIVAHNFVDLTGQTFERLTVLKKVNTKNDDQAAYWICKCSCGKVLERPVRSHDLTSGKIKSCGCLRNERVLETCGVDLQGQRFGKLIALERVSSIKERSGQSRTAWLCQCDCGRKVVVKTINLRSGDTQSCGCENISHGEIKIEQFLKDNNISFKAQVAFDDLVSKNNRKLRFDFGVYNNKEELCYLIEYNGLQHYKSVDYFGGEAEYKNRIYNDNLKKDYCKKNHIPLIIIKYNEIIEKEKVIKYEYIKDY